MLEAGEDKMFNEKDRTTYKKILFPLFFGLGGAMLLYTLSGMITALPLITVFFILSAGSFLYALWNIWQMVDEQFRPKVYGYIALFSAFFHGTTIVVNSYFQGVIATIYGFALIALFWNWLTSDARQNVLN